MVRFAALLSKKILGFIWMTSILSFSLIGCTSNKDTEKQNAKFRVPAGNPQSQQNKFTNKAGHEYTVDDTILAIRQSDFKEKMGKILSQDTDFVYYKPVISPGDALAKPGDVPQGTPVVHKAGVGVPGRASGRVRVELEQKTDPAHLATQLNLVLASHIAHLDLAYFKAPTGSSISLVQIAEMLKESRGIIKVEIEANFGNLKTQ